jgi:hypothetical protein
MLCFENYISTKKFAESFIQGYVLFLTKMCWAAFWAFFTNTSGHPARYVDKKACSPFHYFFNPIDFKFFSEFVFFYFLRPQCNKKRSLNKKWFIGCGLTPAPGWPDWAKFLPIGWLFTYFGQIFCKITEVANIFVLFFHNKSYDLMSTKNGFGNILGDCFSNSFGHPVCLQKP